MADEGTQASGGWLVDAMAVAVVSLACAIAAQVAANAFDLNPVARWSGEVLLFGDALTLNGLLDLQWHLLAAVAFLPAGVVWLRDRHVRVDIVQARFSPRGKAFADLAGNVLFALPFLALMIPAAWGFAAQAWRIDEGSANGGLGDLWLVKGVLPLGLVLLAAAILWECVRLLAVIAGRRNG